MLTIGTIPSKVKRFFRPLHLRFTRPAWSHFWRIVLALCVAHGATLERLVRAMRSPCHRTKHGEFLWKSRWDHAAVVQAIALDLLRRLRRKDEGTIYFILDETQTLKRAKKMAAVGRLYHHATGRYCTGHTMLKVCLWYRGVTIPWGTWLYVKKEDAPKLKVDFATLTDLAATAIDGAALPKPFNVVVLFDSYYLCSKVVQACQRRGWHFVGVGKSNRRFKVQGEQRKLAAYGRNVLSRSGQWCIVQGLNKSGTYRLAERIGTLKKLGEVKVVFSKRKGESKLVALVTDDLRATARKVVADYLKRWAVELLIKDEKQQLGLGDYRVLRYQAVVRHLHLVDCAYGCLTHLALKELGAQGEKNKRVLHLPPISQLKTRMRQMIWQEAVEEVIKTSHEKPVIRRLEKLLAA
jgi:SRSO17 transposase